MEKPRILFFSPHPDDHFCAAGTIMKLIERGYEYHEILFSDAELSGNVNAVNVNKAETKRVRIAEFENASAFLGTKKYYRLELPNDGIEYSRELFLKLIEIIRTVRPEIAIMPHYSDYHRDHRKVNELATDAVIRADNSFQLQLGDRYRVPVNFLYRGINPLDRVDLLVDITNQFERVVELMKHYNSQVTPRMQQLIEAGPWATGYYMRAKYAEAFEIPKNIPIFPNKVLADLT